MIIMRTESIMLNEEELQAFEKVMHICLRLGSESEQFDVRTLANDTYEKLSDLWNIGEFAE